MAGAIRSLIVGGGIRAGSPATLLTFPIFSGATPPDILIDGNIRQSNAATPKVYIGQANYTATCTVLGGAIANANILDGIVIGELADWTPANTQDAGSVIIGPQALGGESVNAHNVVIGAFATAAGTATANNCVILGHGAGIVGSSAGANVVAIGSGCQASLGSQLVLIGGSTTWASNNVGVIVGYNSQVSGGAGVSSCMIIGCNSNTNKTRNLLIGMSLVDTITAGDLLVFGQSWTSSATMPANAVGFFNSSGYTTFIVGKSHDHATPTAVTFRTTNGLGANIAGANMILQSGLGTGTGASSSVSINSSIPIGAGSTVQTARTGFQVLPSVTAADTDVLVYDVTAAILQRVSIGAANSGGAGFRLLRIPN